MLLQTWLKQMCCCIPQALLLYMHGSSWLSRTWGLCWIIGPVCSPRASALYHMTSERRKPGILTSQRRTKCCATPSTACWRTALLPSMWRALPLPRPSAAWETATPMKVTYQKQCTERRVWLKQVFKGKTDLSVTRRFPCPALPCAPLLFPRLLRRQTDTWATRSSSLPQWSICLVRAPLICGPSTASTLPCSPQSMMGKDGRWGGRVRDSRRLS